MAFTKRHYEEVARIIRTERERTEKEYGPAFRMGLAPAVGCGAEGATKRIQTELRRMFAADNPRFDGTRFDMACEPREVGK